MESFAHEAVVALAGRTSPAALGEAVTVALCGHWTHPGACRWPHDSAVTSRDDSVVTLRVEFACPPREEDDVRRLVCQALRAGAVVGPHGTETWTLLDERPVSPRRRAVARVEPPAR